MKNKFTIFFVLAVTLMIMPARSQAEHLESNGQLMLSLGRTFAPYEVYKDISGAFYAHGSGFLSLRADPIMFTYIGPEFSYLGHNLKFLTGTFLGIDGAISLVTSIWGTLDLGYDLSLFLEGDAYFPVDGEGFGHEFRQYYTYASLSYTFNQDSGLGVSLKQENFFSEDDFFELAFGPSLDFKEGSIWLAYDVTPEVKGDRTIIFRLTICF